MMKRFLPSRKVLFYCWLAFDVFFLPLTLIYLLPLDYGSIPEILGNIIGILMVVPMIAGLLLRAFYIPQILAGILILLSILRLIQDCRSNAFQWKTLFLLLLFIIVCAANLWILEIAVQNAMYI